MFTWEIMSWLFKDPVVIMKEIMSWLFKDLIVTGAWLNLNHPNQTVKNDIKRSNCPKAPFILQNVEKILRANPELSGCAIFGPKMAH